MGITSLVQAMFGSSHFKHADQYVGDCGLTIYQQSMALLGTLLLETAVAGGEVTSARLEKVATISFMFSNKYMRKSFPKAEILKILEQINEEGLAGTAGNIERVVESFIEIPQVVKKEIIIYVAMFDFYDGFLSKERSGTVGIIHYALFGTASDTEVKQLLSEASRRLTEAGL